MPKPSAICDPPTATRTPSNINGKKMSKNAPERASASATHYTILADQPLKKLFIHVKDPDNQAALMQIKQTCNDFPGINEIVLVLGEDKKSAIKMPFRVDTSDELIGRLVKILGEDAVVLK